MTTTHRPRRSPQTPEAALSDAPDPQHPSADARARVCLIDDDPTSLAAAVATLRQRFEVAVARSAEDGLRLIQRRPPDVVLLDIDMPGMDGLTLCRLLKADVATEPLPVVFLTAHGDEATELAGLAAGAADFIQKPPRGPVVMARLDNLVRLKRLSDQLRRDSLTDGLTGLANRACFDRTLQQELLRSNRQDQPLSLLLLDLDHFKAYNDHYGHLAGDEALRRVAQALAGCALRAGDVACRYGGEEFALVLPSADREGARRLADRVVAAVDRLALPHAASRTAPHVTVSVGVATVPAGANPSSVDAAGLIERADRALYAAKRAGRNRSAHDEDGVSEPTDAAGAAIVAALPAVPDATGDGAP